MEAILVSVLTALATAASNRLASEACLLCPADSVDEDHVHQTIQQFRDHLTTIRDTVRDADQRAPNDPIVQRWLGRTREVLFELEDAMDSYTYGMSAGAEKCLGLSRNVAKKCERRRRLQETYKETAVALKRLQDRVTEIVQTCESSINAVIQRWIQKNCAPVDCSAEIASSSNANSTMVKFNDGKYFWNKVVERNQQTQIEQLVKAKTSPPVIAVVCGMPGIGKSTLVGSIYHKKEITQQFNSFAWVTVSEACTTENLLRNLLKGLEKGIDKGDIDRMDTEKLQGIVSPIVCNKRCLIVFDDVWETNFWDQVQQYVFPQADVHSRILVTTRSMDVARSFTIEDSRIVKLDPLDSKQALSLFYRKAFGSDQGCPANLKPTAKAIVEKCEGLPLAIVVSASVAITKARDASSWENALRKMKSDIVAKPEMEVLKLWYYDLPANLKQCLLYWSIFPEGHELEKDEIVRLWVAEGFIELNNSAETLEEVAEDYLDQLINRSMIQVTKQKGIRRKALCSIHSVLRMVITSMSDELGFATFLLGEEFPCSRRLSARNRLPEFKKGDESPKLRSLFLLGDDNFSLLPSGSLLFRFNLLKVLVLQGVKITAIPDGIFNLFNLRYLSLSRVQIPVRAPSVVGDAPTETHVAPRTSDLPLGSRRNTAHVFPRKVERLQLLQTLNIWNTTLKQLPRSTAKLGELRHLIFGGREGTGFEAPISICELTDLQTLMNVKASDGLVRHIGRLRKLRTLWMSGVKRRHEEDLCTCLTSLTRLRELSIRIDPDDGINLASMNGPPQLLRSFSVTGKLEGLPRGFGDLPQLRYLYLMNSRLEREPIMASITPLNNLAQLELVDAYKGQSLTFPEKSLPVLEMLSITDLPGLASIEITTGALNRLRKLTISRCRNFANWSEIADKLSSSLEELHGVPEDKIPQLQAAHSRLRIQGDDGRDCGAP